MIFPVAAWFTEIDCWYSSIDNRERGDQETSDFVIFFFANADSVILRVFGMLPLIVRWQSEVTTRKRGNKIGKEV